MEAMDFALSADQPADPARPALGAAPLPADSVAELLARNASDPIIAARPAIIGEDRTWTHQEYLVECRRWANLLLTRRRADQPFHVAVLLDNIPEYLFALGGAALAGAAVVGLNHSRSGTQLIDDARATHCGLLVYEQTHADLAEPLMASGLFATDEVLLVGPALDRALAAVDATDPGIVSPLETTWALIFTSGTTAAPKAVICSHRRMLTTGSRMAIMMGLEPRDVGYLCMPLFHSNSLQVGWMSAQASGAAVSLRRRFSASGWLPDVRRYGVTYWNYTGKPLAYLLAQPERPDDGDNSLRVAYGNEGAPSLVAAFAERFGVEVIDAFGATEGGLAVTRSDGDPPGAMGVPAPGVQVVDEAGRSRPAARFGAAGELLDPMGCVGEIVNTAGVGVFEGYYNNDEANARATRNGWYWSGDLGYVDEAGYLYFAGRNADWIRVDGENFPAGPIQDSIARHPDLLATAVYGVPDPDAGDQVMAAVVPIDGATLDPQELAIWLDAQPDLARKWRPRYVRISARLPVSPTNKVLTRTLVHEKYRPDRTGDDVVWVRDRDAPAYRLFTAQDARELREALEQRGRARFWDL
jgi:fatty-acyl-CoA synthase